MDHDRHVVFDALLVDGGQAMQLRLEQVIVDVEQLVGRVQLDGLELQITQQTIHLLGHVGRQAGINPAIGDQPVGIVGRKFGRVVVGRLGVADHLRAEIIDHAQPLLVLDNSSNCSGSGCNTQETVMI